MEKEISTLGGQSYDQDSEGLRRRILAHLAHIGFTITDEGKLSLPEEKSYVRNAHKTAVNIAVQKNWEKIQKYEPELIDKYVIDGRDLDVANIEPELIQVDKKNTNLFNWVKLHWSIPISAGYGRRLRYIVKDKTNGAVIGIIGLADPVFGIKDRDNLIGWAREARLERLRNVMDAFVLGSIPPYSSVLGGKLIASLLASPLIRTDFSNKYKGKRSLISGRIFDGKLALITTASAFGKSSVYDRIKISQGPEMIHAGWSSGSGEFHLFSDFYNELTSLVREDIKGRKNPLWGSGVRNRRVVICAALDKLNLPRELIYHNIKRELFAMPLGYCSFEFLRGESKNIGYYDINQHEIVDFIKNRWMVPRSIRDNRYLNFKKDQYSIIKNYDRFLDKDESKRIIETKKADCGEK